MAVKFVGDSRRFIGLIRRFSEMADPAFRLELNHQLANEAHELAMQGFERSISPYGKRWKNPRSRPGGKPLLDTTALRISIDISYDDHSFGLWTDIIYAAPHQYGWKERNIAQRQFLPIGSRGFGGRWTQGFHDVTRDYVRQTLVRDASRPKRARRRKA